MVRGIAEDTHRNSMVYLLQVTDVIILISYMYNLACIFKCAIVDLSTPFKHGNSHHDRCTRMPYLAIV